MLMSRTIRCIGVAAIAGALALTPVASSAGSYTVRATESRAWKPAGLTVTKGSKVTWKNPTSTTHNIVAYKGAWSYNKTLSSGSRAARTFKQKGTYKYRCTLHSDMDDGRCDGMCGKIVVR